MTGRGSSCSRFSNDSTCPTRRRCSADPNAVSLPERGDLVHAMLATVVDASAATATEARWRAGWELVARLVESVPVDLIVAQAMDLAALRDPDWPPPAQLDRLGALEELLKWGE